MGNHSHPYVEPVNLLLSALMANEKHDALIVVALESVNIIASVTDVKTVKEMVYVRMVM